MVLPFTIVLSLILGAVSLSFSEIFNGLFSQENTVHQTILLGIRLPRVLLTASIGAILALSGAVMQGLFRNPLADPSLIGVTAGASLGASIVIVLVGTASLAWVQLPLVSLGAFLGGVLVVAAVYRLARRGEGTSVATMLLAGIGIAALVGSCTSLLEFYADNYMLRRISLWRMGSLEGANYGQVVFAVSIVVMFFLVLPRYSQALNALLLGESEARHLGIAVEKLKRILIVLVALGVGVSVALAGTIGFVGLVVPHIMRLWIGPDHRLLLPAAGLFGAILLVIADTLGRTLLAPTELPVGLVTAIIGVPFFLSLLTRRYVYGLS